MTRERLITLLLVCCMFGCSSDDKGDDGNGGGPAFPTTDVAIGDGGPGSDAATDSSSLDTSEGDAGSAQDSGNSSDVLTDVESPKDSGALQDTPSSPDSNVEETSQQDTAPEDIPEPKDEGPGPGDSEDLLCAAADPWTGKGVPFKGLTYTAPTNQSYNFTCTKCPGGIAGFEGKYRWFSEKWNVLPNTPQTFQAADIDTIDFDGNWFTISRRELNTGKIDTASGYYFCPDEAELGFAKTGYFNTVWYFDSIQGTTMFNTKPGTVNPVHVGGNLDVIETQGAPNWNPNSGGVCPGPDCLDYCRVGATVNGVPCTAPW